MSTRMSSVATGPQFVVRKAGLMNGSENGSSTANASSTENLSLESPLKLFVLAKRKINDIYAEIDEYVQECKEFLQEQKDDIVTTHQLEEVEAYAGKVAGIRDVLQRDHMKVAFFGRTSNGKSTVINAVLQNKILPSGLGHTTNCFLQVEGCDEEVPYLIVEDEPLERLNVESVSQLANALNTEKMGDSTLVRIYWPKNKCPLLRDDVVLVDSPGIDVSPNLDEWIDKHCLDADVFVLVSNSESTLMQTEKAFFHKVSEKLSQPNIFILNNRWEQAASEPEIVEKVRKQHMSRDVAFLCDELNVIANQIDAAERIYFVSAKEVLQARLKQQEGMPLSSGAIVPEGFQNRYFAFEEFERKFEECLSHSAVKTKFDQHSRKGKRIAVELARFLEYIHQKATQLKTSKSLERRERFDKLEAIQKQMTALTNEVKHQISHLVEQVECKVSSALSEEIRRLSLLVADFEKPFSSDSLALSVYKKELHCHVERGLGSNLRARLSTAVQMHVEAAQKDMVCKITSLLPPTEAQNRQIAYGINPRHNFEILYRINCESLCADFQEDLEFRFSFGILQMLKRFFGNNSVVAAKLGQLERSDSVTSISSGKSLPPTAPQTPSNDTAKTLPPTSTPSNSTVEILTMVEKFAMVAPQSQTTIGLLAIGGFFVRTIGWRVIVVTSGVYALLYVYERLTWTNKAKERTFKKQYVNHATRKLKLIVDLTSANCSHQVQQELSSTFARLCHIVDEVITEMQIDIRNLDSETERLEKCAETSKYLKNKASFICSELDNFVEQFLVPSR